MCLLYLKVICAHPWGPKEAFGDLKSPKIPLLTASFLRPFATGHPVSLSLCQALCQALYQDLNYHIMMLTPVKMVFLSWTNMRRVKLLTRVPINPSGEIPSQ